MNRISTTSAVITLVLMPNLFGPIARGDNLYWYEVSILHGTEPYEFYGSSTYNPESFVDSIKQNGFIRIDNLMFLSKSNGKTQYKKWKEWDPAKKTYIYLSTKHIIAIHPLIGDPQTITHSK